MLFETLTITSVLLAKCLIEWKATKSENTVDTASVHTQELPENVVQQTCTIELDENQTERRNEIFLKVFSILMLPDKSQFQELTVEIKQLVSIYRISSKLDSEEMAKYVVDDFKEYVSALKNSEIAVDRFKALQPLLEYSFRMIEKDGVLIYYFRDIDKDKDYIEKVLPNIYGCFDLILLDRFSGLEIKVPTENIKNYNCLLGTAGNVYNNLVKVLYAYKLFDARGRLSHELLYEMADYILKSTDFYFNRGLPTGRLAKDITDSIIHYIHNDVEIEQEFKEKYGGHPEQYVGKLIERYLMNREIESYYYFLKMACKVLEALGYNKTGLSQEDENRIEIAKKKLSNIDLPILANYRESDILEDIEKAFKYKDAKLSGEVKK